MEALYDKIREYVNMDTEISAEEFFDYYKMVIDKLTSDYDDMTEDDLFRGKMIAAIVSSNAASRAKRKDANAKKFKKAYEKSKFWADAIEYRLKKSGLSEDEISERSAALEKEMQ